jgi:hypothetical protein
MMRLLSRPNRDALTVGNAGDLYNRDLIRHLYGSEAINVDTGGRRLLLVGSTVHRAQPGDVIAGVGSKGSTIAIDNPREAEVWGVRGPLTADALRARGFDLSNLRFILDPGLLIAQVFPELQEVRPVAGRVIFAPHYRERSRFRRTKRYDVVNVDASALEFAREIALAETVFTSSLHGLIFAHALGRPTVLVAPLTAEPELKYRDYFASVGLRWKTPLPLDEAIVRCDPVYPDNVGDLITTAKFPSLEELRARGIST